MERSKSESLDVTRRILRRRRRVRQRTYKRKHHSADSSLKIQRSLTILKPQEKSRPNTAGSVDSVIYVGHYKKIIPLIVLEDSSDDDSSKKMGETNFPANTDNTSQETDLSILNNNNELDLLSKLQEMQVDSTVAELNVNS